MAKWRSGHLVSTCPEQLECDEEKRVQLLEPPQLEEPRRVPQSLRPVVGLKPSNPQALSPSLLQTLHTVTLLLSGRFHFTAQ